MERKIPITTLNDEKLKAELSGLNISLSCDEARRIAELIGRDPTIVELYIFNAEWSEHCSYKSSRGFLKLLPKDGPQVVSTDEDAGIIRLCEINKESWCLVVAHESHNHPSQLLPYEGAATGIGGIVRDVDCMGADVIGVCDSLRFGSITGQNKNQTKWIASGVVEGVGGYGNALGVPNLGGDIYFSECFDENCLVNVVALGIVKENEIIHSKIPEEARNIPYSIILVGKPTDYSGFGGASFASEILDDERERKGAVQIPDPFLKNVLAMKKANKAVFNVAREKGVVIGMKDLGGGGIACGTSEIASAGGFGVEIDLSTVPQIEGLLPEVITCSETQERYILAVPDKIVPDILAIYNEDWELSHIFEGARASVIGKPKMDGMYILKHKGEVVCSLPAEMVTSGISYSREEKPIVCDYSEPEFEMPDLKEAIYKVISHPNVASKLPIFSSYDMEVQGKTVIRAGAADASLIAPLIDKGSAVGVAVSCDGNPFYGKIDPFWAGVNAVYESYRNVASIGAVPECITDCLNYGNPEKPEAFYQFAEGVRGIAFACQELGLPVVSGNVSLYNESAKGRAIDPSPIIACFGVMKDFTRAVTMELKSPDNLLYLVGERKDELGGSVYYQTLGFVGRNIPKPDLKKERKTVEKIIDLILKGVILSCHDISDGGMITAIIEMAIKGNLGAELIKQEKMRIDKFLFSETGGFILEVSPENGQRIEEELDEVYLIASVLKEPNLLIESIKEIPLEFLKRMWDSEQMWSV
ncbi:phosphoribosylformylglycinamidine synthase subunit PurL [bacterium]|nr:phosphoribosylformylglycinamidine synthase subunit PurL [bacterium]